MLRVAEQMGLNPKWISCVILAPDQLQDYLPDVKVHMFCSSNSKFLINWTLRIVGYRLRMYFS